MGWTKVVIQNTDNFRAFKVQNQFKSIFITACAPKEAAMFKQKGAHEESVIYFSPLATELFVPFLHSLPFSDCETPSRDDVSLLVGHVNAFEMLAQGDENPMQSMSMAMKDMKSIAETSSII